MRPEKTQNLPLKDSFERPINYLRVSLTDRCNLRCVYCMPPEGIDLSPRDEILSYEEILRVARLGADRGIRKVRLTGGEPLVRRDLCELIRALKATAGIEEVVLTTNGLQLEKEAWNLAEAGLDRVNVSLDSLRRERFEAITRFDGLDKVLKGLRMVEATPMRPIKVNVVVARGFNEDEILDFAEFARSHPYEVRFIEHMPFAGLVSLTEPVTAEEILETVRARWPLVAAGQPGPSAGPARNWRFADGRGVIGVIGPMSCADFCTSCSRLRLTADGQLRTCLLDEKEVDLRGLLRSRATDEQIAQRMEEAVSAKEERYPQDFGTLKKCSRAMTAIGG
jgi:cyclic pyranopterin phosphate synthase